MFKKAIVTLNNFKDLKNNVQYFQILSHTFTKF